MPVIEAEGLLFEIFSHTDSHDILEFKERSYYSAESPEFEDSTDFTLYITDLARHLRQKVGDSLWERGFYGDWINHVNQAFRVNANC